MPSPAVEAAKFLAPTTAAALPRPELLARLAAAGSAAKWVTAPSGAGKSTLAALYAEADGRTPLWYRLDERDADPAFFFRTLASRLARVVAPAPKLPAFADADRGRETLFARRYFRALAAAAPATLIVFDDAQEIADSAVPAWLAEAVAVCLPPLELVLLSQTAPPAALYDALMAQRLTELTDLDLRFSATECARVGQRLGLARADGEMLAALSGGHAGALVLACGLLRGAPATRAEPAAVADKVHGHLLQKVVARLTPTEREVLHVGCVLPELRPDWLDALLPALDVGAALQGLTRQGLLLRHDGADGPLYTMHALVRQGARKHFLAQDAQAATGVERRCALLLDALRRHDDAFALWLDLDDHDAAFDALERLAQDCARARQATRLIQALARVPAERIPARPLLSFWAGQCLLGVDSDAAREWFVRAYRGFEEIGDAEGAALAAASLLCLADVFEDDNRQLPAWLEAFGRWRKVFDLGESMPLRGVYLLGIVCEANNADAGALAGTPIAAALDALTALVDREEAWPSRDLALAAARTVVDHVFTYDSFERTFHYERRLRHLVDDPGAAPLLQASWWLQVGLVHLATGDLASAQNAVEQLRALIEQNDLRAMRVGLTRLDVGVALRARQLPVAERALAEAERFLPNPSADDLAKILRLGVRVRLAQRRYPEALHRAEAALAAAHEAGLRGAPSVLFEVDLAYALAANQRGIEGAERLETLMPLLGPVQRDVAQAIALSLRAAAVRPPDREALRNALALARQTELTSLLNPLPDQCAELCAAALTADIEPDFVRTLIAAQQLAPPPAADEHWPWPVRIWTLGGFRLEVDGQPYRPERKAQDRPLELLKLLLACRAQDQPAPAKTWLAERLWPEADADSARKALDMTISRLRRLLGGDERLESADGGVQLTQAQVWSDVRQVLTATAELGALRAARMRGAAVGNAGAALSRLIAAYKGEFLPGGEEPPWLLAARARLGKAFSTAVMQASEADLPAADLTAALEHALQIDPTAEELTRALMTHYLRHGERAAALRVYRRCREILSVVLGLRPSAATEALLQEINGAARGGDAAPQGRMRS